ncbi:hypothetical protein B5S32_g2749 [[Candida] boidinii]|nr:hypothetical protein B5S32_g2749 [[Candida] boidinii]
MNTGSSNKEPALFSFLKSFSKSFRPSSSDNDTRKTFLSSINPTIVGSDIDQQLLSKRLQTESNPERIKIIISLRNSLREINVSSIPEIWYLVRSFISPDTYQPLRKETLSLMYECIHLSDSATSTKLMYYKDIIENLKIKDDDINILDGDDSQPDSTIPQLDPDINLFISCLSILTNNGEDIYDLIQFDTMPLNNYISAILNTLVSCNKQTESTSNNTSNSTVTNDNIDLEVPLTSLLKLLSSILLTNLTLFENNSMKLILKNLISSLYITKTIENTSLGLKIINIFSENDSTFPVVMNNYDDLLTLLTGIIGSNYIKSEYRLESNSTILESINTFTILLVNANSFVPLSILSDIIANVTKQEEIIGSIIILDNLVINFQKPPIKKELNSILENYFNNCFDSLLNSLNIGSEFERQKNFSNNEHTQVINNLVLKFLTHLFKEPFLKNFRIYSFDSSNFVVNNILNNILSAQYENPSIGLNENLSEFLETLKKLAAAETSKNSLSTGGLIRLPNFLFNLSKELISSNSFDSVILGNENLQDLNLNFYITNMLCVYLMPGWEQNMKFLIDNYFKKSNNYKIKLKSFDVFMTSYSKTALLLDTNNELEDSEKQILFKYFKFLFEDFVLSLEIRNGSNEDYNDLSSHIMINTIEIISTLNDSLFSDLIDFIYKNFYNENFKQPTVQTFISKLLVRLTLQINNTHSANHIKFTKVFDVLQSILNYCLTDRILYTNFIIISKLLVRVRKDENNIIYFSEEENVELVNEVLNQNNRLRSLLLSPTSSTFNSPESDEQKYIPKSLLGNNSIIESKIRYIPTNEINLDLTKWLKIVVKVLDNFYDWELYSFLLNNLSFQLVCYPLFRNSDNHNESITTIQKILCEHLLTRFPPTLKLPLNTSKSDIQVAIIHFFTPFTGYKDLFNRQEQDLLVQSTIHALESWNKTGTAGLNFLNICCYEFPLSIKKYLSSLLIILQRRITSPYTSPYILDLLLALSHMPTLISNFTTDEFKRIFAIAFKYIEYSEDLMNSRNNIFKNTELTKSSTPDSNSNARNSTDFSVPPAESEANNFKNIEITRPLLQYLLSLSYRVIAGWYLKLNIDQRRNLSSFIIRNLTLRKNDEGNIEDTSLAFIDFVSRFASSELDLCPPALSELTVLDSSSRHLKKQWIYGSTLFTIYTDKFNGDSSVILRRPTSISQYNIKLDERYLSNWLVSLKSNTDAVKAETDNEDSNISDLTNNNSSSNNNNTTSNDENEEETGYFHPNYLMLNLLYPLSAETTMKPIPIPDKDAALNRSIAGYDRLPTINFYKVGIVYIGPGQKDELEILKNLNGSPSYNKFISGLGNLIRLKGCKRFYLGGLDTENNTDGEFAIHYSNEIVQMIYHTITMMPNNPNDTQSSAKKRHIGNDFINIYWDESGYEFDFNKISSQFNFISLVITPISNENDKVKHYKVKLHRRSGIPALFSTCQYKIISEDVLTTFIRNTCMVCCQFSAVWTVPEDETYISNWNRRVTQFRTILSRCKNHWDKIKTEQKNDSSNHNSLNNDLGISTKINDKDELLNSNDSKNRHTNANDNSDVVFSFISQLSNLDINPKDTANNTSHSNADTSDSNHKKALYEFEFPNDTDDPLYKKLELNSF